MTERSLVIPKEWVDVKVPAIDTKTYDGSSIQIPAHTIQIALRYPVDDKGSLIADMTQKKTAKFINDYNTSHKLESPYTLKLITLAEDEAVRDALGKDHTAFDENFQRNGQDWHWSYVADFTKPYGKGAEGIGQDLVTRIVGYRLPGGDVEIGPVTIAPDGMVPTISRVKLEKMIGADGLKLLEKLRGKDIYEKDEEIVDVRNALGFPQYTLDHNAKDEIALITHSHHVYTPSQDDGEAVGFRLALWLRGRGDRCFSVDLSVDPGDSCLGRSFPLVRGDKVEAKVTKQSYAFTM
ncbi:MAG: hypothetical protein NT120_04470 [Candidatus Aenigmarchaeota archaeon]|nr:hypothetical protein [Candidatus Aenigmarchaeota archaeon]